MANTQRLPLLPADFNFPEILDQRKAVETEDMQARATN
jgi:hypothetical protein